MPDADMDAGVKQWKRQTKSHCPWSACSLETAQTIAVDSGMKKEKHGYKLQNDGKQTSTI